MAALQLLEPPESRDEDQAAAVIHPTCRQSRKPSPRAPLHTSRLLSRTYLRRLIREQVGAARVSEEALSELEEAVERIVAALTHCIGSAWQAQLESRRIQSASQTTEPELRSRHIAAGLRALPAHWTAFEAPETPKAPEVKRHGGPEVG